LGKERDERTKDMLLSVIGSVNKPEVVALTTRLATSNDVAQRKEGLVLLRQMPESAPEVRNVVKQILATEQSPDVLVQALSALRPSVVEPSESDAIVSQLRTLAQNADPNVRSQSLLQLVQWDKNGSANDQLAQALSDPQAQVRQAAIFAVAQSGNRSDNVKATLMNIINSPSESKEVKGSALQVLERFSLNKEEYASYNQVRSQIGL
jgi:HEAT repeat protein